MHRWRAPPTVDLQSVATDAERVAERVVQRELAHARRPVVDERVPARLPAGTLAPVAQFVP
jgi:hypothetical protein